MSDPVFDVQWPQEGQPALASKFRAQFQSLSNAIAAVPAGPPGPAGLPVVILNNSDQVPPGLSMVIADGATVTVTMPPAGMSPSFSLLQMVATNGGQVYLADPVGGYFTDCTSMKLVSLWAVGGMWNWTLISQMV